ncbi:DUF4952 domain-containing protein [Bizionia argentinensis JUB59]|uniref:DUF4952 domain-containing protein n=1 Tax=Bizionia argentinensis JUB59 TaxID=1046627 RepID=G2ECQ3_9FLAO|nr:DUF4952 domain-containing protein [Bizionia argentinensis]EGV43804.1 DUF4952 domain-containing protein [Bizionia argentinensis JUB59]
MYRVPAHRSIEIEAFLIETYGMGSLKWACCGWDSAGVYGDFGFPALTEIDRDLSGFITMFASGEIIDPITNDVRLELDRSKIDYFYIRIDLMII